MEQAKTGELMPRESTALGAALPSFIPAGDTSGTEGIERDDIQMPRLALAQGLSPQMLPNKPEYIQGLSIGMMFNTLTGQIYGNGPLVVSVVRADRPRWVEFDDDRNMLDPDVPAGDPRTLWTFDDVKRERVPPRATQFYDFIVVIMTTGEPIALSMARTGITAAKRLNGLIKMRVPPIPIYAGLYEIKSALESNDSGTYGVWIIKNAGVIQDETEYRYAEGLYKSLANKTINIDRAHDADTDFDSQAIEAGR